MANATVTAADARIRHAVTQQLEWDPTVEAGEIGVTAKNGAVTLTGFIDTYAGKLAAERAAKRVRGVRAVANDIAVRLKLERPDPDIARDAALALDLRGTIPESVQAVVHGGCVTLTGAVAWLFQRRDAEKAVRHVRGVRHVSNHITVAAQAMERDVRHHIVEALHRSADVDARQIAVTIAGTQATLSGEVRSWAQRDAAEHAAAQAAGVTDVINLIAVTPPDSGEVSEIC
jgi:osmotically-inducible protein OsmY